MRQTPNARLHTLLQAMSEMQQRELLRDLIAHMAEAGLQPVADVILRYLAPDEVEQLLGTMPRLTDARLYALVQAAGMNVRRYRHGKALYYQIAGWYKDPRDKPGKMKLVTKHLCAVERLPLIPEAFVEAKIAEVKETVATRKAAAERAAASSARGGDVT